MSLFTSAEFEATMPEYPGQSLAGMVPGRLSADQRAELMRAWTLMGQHQWERAVDLLDGLDRPGVAGRMALRTASNMQALERYVPAVYETLRPLFPIDAASRHYRPVRSKAGWPTIVARTIEGDKLIHPIDDPAEAARRDLAKLAPSLDKDVPVLIAGVSDGYFFDALGKRDQPLTGGRHAAVYVIEPEPDLMLANLALHDWAGPRGPIGNNWIEWFVGRDWVDQLVERLERQWMLPVPGLVFGRKDLHDSLKESMARIKAHRRQSAAQQRERALTHGVYTARRQLVGCLRGKAGRPPKVLIVGSRFLGEVGPPLSLAQVEHAFEQLGWQTQTRTELADHHRLTPLVLWDAIGRFEPDLVFSVGERWADRREAIDPRIPIVRWIDAARPSTLTSAEKHELNLRDFVLAHIHPLYGRETGYPRRQLLELPGVVQAGDPAVSKTEQDIDLLYLGEGGEDPRHALDQTVEQIKSGPLRELAMTVGEQMIALYEQGGCCATRYDIARLIRDAAAQTAGVKPSDVLHRRFALMLSQPFNEALYRQQALGWAAEVADGLGLKLAIHGKDWNHHRAFREVAHRAPTDREQAERLMARAKLNLHIAPRFCLDAKLMDGLSVGGFFLVRRHPADALLPELGAFIEAYCGHDADTAAAARQRCDAAHRERFDRLIDRARWIADLGEDMDPVRCVRACMHGGLIDRHHVALPRLDLLQFDSAAELKACVQRFINAPDQRREIVRRQRAAVEHRLSFPAGLSRAIQRVADLIEREED